MQIPLPSLPHPFIRRRIVIGVCERESRGGSERAIERGGEKWREGERWSEGG